jgi:hypothetical protein
MPSCRCFFPGYFFANQYGIFFAVKRQSMDLICHHCGELIVGRTYRVMSEESGVTLLDMIVCYFCYLEARRLGLPSQQMNRQDSNPKPRHAAT